MLFYNVIHFLKLCPIHFLVAVFSPQIEHMSKNILFISIQDLLY